MLIINRLYLLIMLITSLSAITSNQAKAVDIQAGKSLGQDDLKMLCRDVCIKVGMNWNGQFNTRNKEGKSVCGCEPSAPK